MLNAFLIRYASGHIHSLDDLVIHKAHGHTHGCQNPYFLITNLKANNLNELTKAIREVSPGFRTLLQKLDDEIEALQNRRKDMLIAAFEDGLQLSVDELNDFLVGDDDDDAVD